MRHDESVNVMKLLGVPEQNVIFLGYPDGGTNGMWQINWDYNNLHRGLNGIVKSPYPFSYEKSASYCGANVVNNLSEIFNTFNPTDIVYPDPNDEHHDHWATNAFVKYVLTLQHRRVKEWTYLVHRSDFPWPWIYDSKLQLNPPKSLENIGVKWNYLPMSEKNKTTKYVAIKQYKSQLKINQGFLEAFVRRMIDASADTIKTMYVKNSIHFTREPVLSINKTQLWLILPRLIDNSSAIFLSSDTVYDHMRIDKTAWRLVKVKY
ncbi:MAG: hypothetical protein PWQ97_1762 [Tepidanaerobacteraceae bacterium]|jgi:LmbE family N-acetylglucosaminyl deacetylase|nr:hypothetical protein [Tepidanaerobacteraceae bacterium]